jgi:hypothetical protein
VKFDCNGKRPSESSLFLPISRMTDSTLISDYHFLEKVEKSKISGGRLLRDLGCDTIYDRSQGKNKRPKGHMHKQSMDRTEILKQPLLFTSNNKSIQSGTCDSSAVLSSTHYNADEIHLDTEGFNVEQLNSSSKTAQSAVKLDSIEGGDDTATSQVHPLQILEIVPQSDTCDSEQAPSSTILLKTDTQKSTTCNLNLISNKDWLARYPPYLHRLVEDAERFCQINLLLLPVGMQRRTLNKDTRYDLKRKGMLWGRIEYTFHSFMPKSEPSSNMRDMEHVKTTLSLENIHDSTTIQNNLLSILNQYLSHSGSHALDAPSRNVLKSFCGTLTDHPEVRDSQAYSYFPRDDICIVMKRIPSKASNPKYIQLRYTSESNLRECLRETTIIEYPTLDVVLRGHLHHFPCIIEDADQK